MENPNELLSLSEAAARVGLNRRTLNNRVQQTGTTIYISGRDRRLRLIAERDLPRLTEVRPMERRETVTEESR